jgi:hypothetical protein
MASYEVCINSPLNEATYNMACSDIFLVNAFIKRYRKEGWSLHVYDRTGDGIAYRDNKGLKFVKKQLREACGGHDPYFS